MKKLPVILQNDSIECGLAAVAMVLHYHGCFVKLRELRDKCSLSLSGVSIALLVKLVQSFEFTCNVLRVEIDNLQQVNLPAIAHWEANHFVVLKAIKPNSFIIHDSARGKLILSKKEFSKKFSGVVLECKPTEKFIPQKPTSKLSMLRWTKLFPKNPSLIFKIFLFTIVYQSLLLTLPRYLRTGVDNFFHPYKNNLFLLVTVGFVGLRVFSVLARIFKSFCIAALDKILNYHLGEKICAGIMNFPLSYFERHFISDILNRFNSVEQFRQILSGGLLEGFLGFVLAITTLAIMLISSPMLALITLMFAAIYLLVRINNLKYYQAYLFDMIAGKSREQMCFLENIRGIQPIKIFNKEQDRLQEWKAHYAKFLNSTYKNNLLRAFSEYIKEFLFGLEIIFITFAALKFSQPISLGVFYSYLFYRQQFCESIIVFADKINDLKLLLVYQERLEDLVDSPQNTTHQNIFIIPNYFSLRAENVSFKYSQFENNLFEKFNLHVRQGEIIVLTGPSGSGKTTLLKILMGLLEPEDGNVFVGDCLIKNLAPGFISAVMQEDNLLSGSIADNISFFSKEHDPKKIIQCAKLAGILEEIFRMPLKFNTLVGDMGTTLSGGQKQRLLLARALYINPKILFLDEATSHLDISKEREINQKIRSLGITIIMIAHRQETIAMADRIIRVTH